MALSARDRVSVALGSAVVLAAVLAQPEPSLAVLRAGIDPVSLLIFSIMAIAAAIAAMALSTVKTPDNPVRNKNNPTSLCDEGDFTALLIGRRQVGPMYAWAGNRAIENRELEGGGKFGGGGESAGEEQIYFESAWHILPVGPLFKLWNIRKDGKIIWKGPITPDSHPSGTTIDFGPPGAFTIYWGEIDQPINTDLGDSTRVTIESRWPNKAYVFWTRKKLGKSPTWGQITYEVEYHPQTTLLTRSEGWMPGTKTESVDTDSIIDATNGGAGTATIQIGGNKRATYRPGNQFVVHGNTMPQTELTVLDSVYSKSTNRTTITTEETISGSNDSGYLAPYQAIVDDGANGAHVIAQLLFEPWPHGRNLDQSVFDIESLEVVGETLEDEDLRLSVYIRDGEQLRSALGDIMTDLGLMISLNPLTGLYEFVLIRKPWAEVFDVEDIPEGMLLDPLPVIDNNVMPKAADTLLFQYGDREKKYRTRTIKHDDDGSADLHGIQNIVAVELNTVIDATSASIVAARRAQEGESDVAQFDFHMNRQARAFYPGLAFTVEGYPGVLRIMEVTPEANSANTLVKMISDFYGAPVSTEAIPQTPITTEDEDLVEADAEFSFIELPRYLSDGFNSIIVPRIRDNDSIEKADIHISRDDLTYTRLGPQLSVQTGGVLEANVTATQSWLSVGPDITIEGPDIAQIMDLSGDDVNWRAGRQVAIIEDEIIFVDGVSVIDADTVRLGRCLRGRFGTTKAAHAAGTPVFILDESQIEAWTDILLVAGEDLYVKSQPFTGEAYPLELIDPVMKTLVGRGVVPMRPESLRTQNMRNDFTTGAAVLLHWVYRSTAAVRTGAGMQQSGSDYAPSPHVGNFTLELLTTGDVLKATIGDITSDPGRMAYSISNANLVSWFAGEPTAFKVRLTNSAGGYDSESITITVTRV